MSLRYTGIIIDLVREETGETDYSSTNGVPQKVFLQKMVDAVSHCQQQIFSVAPSVFDITTIIDAVTNQSSYDLPANAYAGASIACMEFSKDGDAKNYYPLDFRDFRYRENTGAKEPCIFTPYGDRSFYIDPYPDNSSGKIRAIHGADLDSPALRSGKIDAVTGTYTSFTLLDDSNLDDSLISSDEYLCVNDKDGNVTYYNAYYTYDSSTRTVTLSGASSSGGSIASGSYITIGKYTTTHVKLHKVAEKVIMAYMRRSAYLGKSSTDAADALSDLKSFTEEMVEAYSKRVRMQKKIPYVGKFEDI